MIIKDGRHIFGGIHEVRKGLWVLFSLLRMLIGWASKLRSHGYEKHETLLFTW